MFRPKLIAKGSTVIRAAVHSQGDVGDRLYREAQKAAERKRQLAQRLAQEEKVRAVI
jgi:hypothetical protein